MDIPITQTKAWQNLQNDLNETTYYQKTDDYVYLAILKKTPVGNYLYLPYGPVASTSASMREALKHLSNLSKEHHCIFIRIEPQLSNEKKYLPQNAIKTKDLNPKETWVLDLSGTVEDVKSRLPSRLLRYFKSSNKKGITIRKSHDPKDIKYLLKLQKALADKKGINTFSEEYLKNELSQPFSTLYLAKYQDPAQNHATPEVIAAGLVFDDETTRYNLQGAQSEQGRKLHATGILTIQLILDAKEKNLKVFDFWGIAPEDAPESHPWAGFTNFKKTFNGEMKSYAGTYDLVQNSFKYQIYKVMRAINILIKKV